MTATQTEHSPLQLLGPDGASVEVIEDSISCHTGDRVTSFQVNGWRFTLAEWNTHGLFVRNSASSRAIPVEKQLKRYLKSPAYPTVWPCEQKGMSGGAELDEDDYLDALRLWDAIHTFTYSSIRNYVASKQNRYGDEVDEDGVAKWKKHTLHKSLLNRHLEPMQWHLMLITASSFENFFDQRCRPDAQPELRVCAELMRDLYRQSDPAELQRGEWHLPYVRRDECFEEGVDLREVSTARCARTSYMTQAGTRDVSEDLRLYNGTLLGGQHMSPFAHVATPDPSNMQIVKFTDPDNERVVYERNVTKMGQFRGFQQWRHVVEGRLGHKSQR